MSPPFVFITIREVEPEINPSTNLRKVDNVIRIYRTELDGVPHYRMHVRRRDARGIPSQPYDIVTEKRRDLLHYLRYIIHSNHYIDIAMYVCPESEVDIKSLPYLEKAAAVNQYENEAYEIVGFSPCEYSNAVGTRVLHGLRVLSAIRPV